MSKQETKKQAVFLNGVFETVLEEIMNAQKKNPGTVFYLQPHSVYEIVYLAKTLPDVTNPITLYISTTHDLDKVCYIADIVGWEDKKEIAAKRITELNEYILKYQPGEKEIYLKTDKGIYYKNLISIINLKRIPNRFSILNLIKKSDNTPYKPRSRAGGWGYVYELPSWLGVEDTVIKEELDNESEKQISESKKDSTDVRRKRLSKAKKIPAQVQVISVAYRRNPDVVVEVLNRAEGKCERCKSDAPFIRAKDNSPYLEIHHWVPLAEGGDDTVENAGALCPNCHRELHFGQKADSKL
ncbi:MAG: HNH endonuclease [Bacteroidales bacterium]|nr:HNH endonuclease [Bacteroidales bacterium]